jgi:DNA-binding SARP family transcriptional activator
VRLRRALGPAAERIVTRPPGYLCRVHDGELDILEFEAACLPHLEHLRLQVQDHRCEAELGRGRHAELIPELRELADGHPLYEHFHAQLMLALVRSGRRAEALSQY